MGSVQKGDFATLLRQHYAQKQPEPAGPVGPSGDARDEELDMENSVMAAVLLDREDISAQHSNIESPVADAVRKQLEQEFKEGLFQTLSSDLGGRAGNKANVQAVSDARSLLHHLEKIRESFGTLSEDSTPEAVQVVLCSAEATVEDALKAAQDIKRSFAKGEVEKVKHMSSSIQRICREWRRKYPDTSPIRINISNSGPQYRHEPLPALIAYCLALVVRIFDGASRRSVDFLLRMLKLFGVAVMLEAGVENAAQVQAIGRIPDDTRTLETARFNLDVEGVVYAVCPECNFTHPPDSGDEESLESVAEGEDKGPSFPKYPDKCMERPAVYAPQCNTPLLLPNGLPVKTFEYYPFYDWFARFLALPGMKEHGDRFCEEVDGYDPNSEDRSKCSAGRFVREVKAPDGRLFVADRGAEGRWFFMLYADFFNVEGNHIGGKSSKLGVMALTCLNLPLTIRNDSAYVYVAGLIPGPKEPDIRGAHHRHYAKPLVNDLLKGYERGVQVTGSNWSRLERLVLAGLRMDFKAARPFCGHVDVGAHLFCHMCDVWHAHYRLRSDYEAWNPVNDERLREGMHKWSEARNPQERDTIESVYGVRLSEFHRLPYFRTSTQLLVDAMHCCFLCDEKQYWVQALGLAAPSDNDDGDGEGEASEICFNYPFTMPPHPSSVHLPGTRPEPNPLFPFRWAGLPPIVDKWVENTRKTMEELIGIKENLRRDLLIIQKTLSQERPSDSEATAASLQKCHWDALFYACAMLLAFPNEELDKLARPTVHHPRSLKVYLCKLLAQWRVDEVIEQAFRWPNFSTRSRGRPIISGFEYVDMPPVQSRREIVIAEVTDNLTITTATNVGTIHRLLRMPYSDSLQGRMELRRKLNNQNQESLKFVCADIDRLPRGQITREGVLEELVAWRFNQRLEPFRRVKVDSSTLLTRIHQALKEVTLPTWTIRPPLDVGLASAGRLKADNWRVLFEIYVPLALLSLYGEHSPLLAENAAMMVGVLETTMALTCAFLCMTKRTPNVHDLARFRQCWLRHIEGIKANFPGFAIPSHHLTWHILECMEQFGSVHNFWCYSGERLIGKLQDIPNNHKRGQYGSTLLHAYCKGARFRQWLLYHDCPGVFRKCVELLQKMYGHQDETTRDNAQVGGREMSDHTVPANVLKLLKKPPRKCFRQLDIQGVRYSIATAHSGNSYVCFSPSDTVGVDGEWTAGRIEHIVETENGIRLVVRPSGPYQEAASDPFRSYWVSGFEAKMVSPTYVGQPQVIDASQLVGHTARWQLSDEVAVVLRRNKD